MLKIKNLLELIFSNILIFFGKKYDISVIPHGLYCYYPDFEKNKISDSHHYYIIPCKYYKKISKNYNGCKYLGMITNDDIFGDQCKICKIHDELNEFESMEY